MDCKKFNIGTEPKKNISMIKKHDQETLVTVSAIPIDSTEKKRSVKTEGRKKLRDKLLLGVFCGICCVSTLICSHLPLPKSMENFFIKLTELITEPVLYKTQLISDEIAVNHNQDQETAATTLHLPAESDSFIPPAENKTVEKTAVIPASVAANLTELSNETAYRIDLTALLSEKYPIEKATAVSCNSGDSISVFAQNSAPTVLIIHTHGTEGYNDTATNNYRTLNSSRNVVAVGKILSEKLREYGIETLHCETMFDASSYIKAYSNSFSAVNEYLSQYPSIKYVIDLHRDAIPDSNGKGYARLISNIDGTEHAQLMFVIGTDEAGATHPGWKSNLRTALEIQKNMCERYPDIMRSINLRKASFNQQLSPGYFILEAGNCENSIEEAFRSAELFAKVFADTIS